MSSWVCEECGEPDGGKCEHSVRTDFALVPNEAFMRKHGAAYNNGYRRGSEMQRKLLRIRLGLATKEDEDD